MHSKLNIRPSQPQRRWLLILKRVLLVVLSLLLILGADALVRMHRAEDGVPVLNYHQINDVDNNALTVKTDQFEAQMKYLADHGYHAITPAELTDAWDNGTKLPDKPVIITFDDGYMDNYKNAYPILQKYNLKATIFLISDFLDTYPNYLTWDQAAEMQQSGLIDFESHTLSHEELDKLSHEERMHQLEDSKKALEWHLQKKIEYIAYPCGDYTQEVQDDTRAAGYRAAFTVHLGYAEKDKPHYMLDRVPIFGGMSHMLERFKLRLEYAPAFVPYEDLRASLRAHGLTWLAGRINTP